MAKKAQKTKHSQRFLGLTKEVQDGKLYELEEAIALVKKTASAKFVESIDVTLRLGVDVRKSDQNVRGITNLPHGTGKNKKVAVLAKGDLAKEAEKAGADYVGSDDLIAKILDGLKDFDVVLATEDMAPSIGKVGKVLGTKTPNKRNGTVTNAIGTAVKEIKGATRVEYRTEKAGIVHIPVGKVNFTDAQILENLKVALSAVLKAKPSTSKGKYLVGLTISSTMGPGVPLDTNLAQKAVQSSV